MRCVHAYDDGHLARFEAKRAGDERDQASAAFEVGSQRDFPIMEGRLFPASCDARH